MVKIIKKFWRIFTSEQKRKVVGLTVMMIIGGILETCSVSLIVPLITVIMDDSFIVKNNIVSKFCKIMNIQTANEFIIFVMVALIAVFLLKNMYLAIEYKIQYAFTTEIKLFEQCRLMTAYLKRPYEFFLYAKSGEIQRNIINDVSQSVELLQNMMSFYTEGIISIALGITIVFVDPVMSGMLIVILGIMLLVIGKVVKPILTKAAHKYQKELSQCNVWIIQAVNGIKEIKITGTEDFFLKNYSRSGKEAGNIEKTYSFLVSVPRLIIETFAICGMLLVIIILMLANVEIENIMPAFSAFAVAAVRLLPSVNRINAAINAVSFREPMLDKMIENIKQAGEPINGTPESIKDIYQSGKMKFENFVELKGIVYKYPKTEKYILNQVDLLIQKGKSVGVVGVSGAGKTTTIDIMLGLLEVQEGEVLCDGKNIKSNYQQWLNLIGYIPQSIFLMDESIKKNIAFGEDEVDNKRLMEAVEEAQLGDFIKSLPDGLETQIGERGVRLSGGQRQRIGIARALYRDPEILVFDEATSSLDNETEVAIMNSINSLHGKKTLIIIAHRLTTIAECDEIYRVENGNIKREK